LNDYVNSEKLKGKSRRWYTNIKYLLKRFNEYLTINNLSLKEVRLKDAGDFQEYLSNIKSRYDKEFTRGSIIHIITAVKGFYNYLKERHIIYNNPFRYLDVMRLEEKVLRHLLKEKELAEYLDKFLDFDKQIDVRKAISIYKSHAISELMYSTGMRISEVSILKPDDIDLEKGIVKITGVKDKKERYGFLNDYAKGILREYLRLKDMLMWYPNRTGGEYLFGCKHSSLYKWFNNILKNMDSSIHFTTHSFRHCFGYHLLRRGCEIRYIQALLGHEDIKSTQVYTNVDKEDLKEVLDECHPRKMRIKDEKI
ncbi:MAG: tyrosine-type recombinase/integrase, partial [Candidatus Pacearchaeota archaeon]|nr:tyrosine-type recombinase/integrase [Candidatus Pacearchaeota archaeon]